MDACAKEVLKSIKEDKLTKSQIKSKFSSKYSEELVDDSLQFLEDEGYINPKPVENLEHYSRITGYYQKVSGWNNGKLQEFKDRHRYSN